VDLPTVWFVFVALLVCAYVVVDHFLWMLAAAGALWFAFPEAAAVLADAFLVPLLLVALLVVVRGVVRSRLADVALGFLLGVLLAILTRFARLETAASRR